MTRNVLWCINKTLTETKKKFSIYICDHIKQNWFQIEHYVTSDFTRGIPESPNVMFRVDPRLFLLEEYARSGGSVSPRYCSAASTPHAAPASYPHPQHYPAPPTSLFNTTSRKFKKTLKVIINFYFHFIISMRLFPLLSLGIFPSIASVIILLVLH